MFADMFMLAMQIAAHENHLPPRTLAALALTSADIHEVVQWRLRRARRIYDKWLPRFGRRLHMRLIGHPFVYAEAERVKVLAGKDLVFDAAGIDLHRSITGLGPYQDFLAGLSLITVVPSNFVIIITVENDPVFMHSYYADEFKQLSVDKYIIDLNLPMRINPLALQSVRILIPQGFLIEENSTGLVIDINVARAAIRHLIVRLKTAIDIYLHTMELYNNTGVTDSRHMLRRSIILSAPDHNVETENTLLVQFMQAYQSADEVAAREQRGQKNENAFDQII